VSNLIPVKKVDKNGRVVTRHMRPEKVGNSAAWLKALTPVPVANERERIIRDCGDFLRDGYNEIALSSLSDKELEDLNSIVTKIELDADFASLRELFNPTKHAPNGYAAMWPELKYDLEDIALYNKLDEGVPLKVSIPLIRGLNVHRFRSVKQEAHQALADISFAASRLLSTTIKDGFLFPEVGRPMPDNLDNFYSFFEDDGEVVKRWIRNQRFVDMVGRRFNDVDEIIRIMTERKTLQPETIEAILDSEAHSSLKDGAL
jgi:hypothetical protein